MAARGEFSSKIGFILAAAGSAVGLGNIWGFPTQVADNGGAAFVVVYLFLAFLLAYPVLMAELIIGRASRSNMVNALERITHRKWPRWFGICGIFTVSLILSFYAIVGGWMFAYFTDSVLNMVGVTSLTEWLIGFSELRNLVFCAVFMLLTAFIVLGGVKAGIEKWSVRLMPTLILLIVGLIIYVSTLPGAVDGWKAYLVPDFRAVLNPDLLISAMGQAFFSMSLGVGTMLIYGSYMSQSENLPSIGASVALVDIGIAVLAGMLIIPAMYVALANGVQIFSESGALIGGDKLIFTVLPDLFSRMGNVGLLLASVFFALMAIAALTSSISMLEVPVAYLVENKQIKRKKSVWLVALIIFSFSAVIIYNFSALFGLVITLTTEYSQPLLGLFLCLFTGWLWHRNEILNELKNGHENAELSFFWKIWPAYIKYFCPLMIALMFMRSLF